jgi:hypothetical protein
LEGPEYSHHVTNLEYDGKGEAYEEELLEAGIERNKRCRLCRCKKKVKK